MHQFYFHRYAIPFVVVSHFFEKAFSLSFVKVSKQRGNVPGFVIAVSKRHYGQAAQ
jgi:hypothetical protein